MAWSVVQGTAVTGTAEDPTPNTGNLLGGASSVFMPMFRVRMRGSSLAGVDTIYKLIKPLSQHTHTAAELGGLPLIQTGSISDDYSANAGATKDFAVSFPVPFKAGTTPVVVASFDSTSTEAAFGKCCLSTLNITGSGFTLRLFNGDTSKRHPGFRWIAVGER
jgi:hypothetical protein